MQKNLTPKEKLFCKAYLANGFNGTQAAITAGYSEKCARQIATRLLTKVHIKQYLQKRMEKIEQKLDMTVEWKLEKLKKCIELSLPEIDGETVLANHNALLGAINESNKMQGHYAPEKHQNTNLNADMEKDQLDELLKQYEKEY